MAPFEYGVDGPKVIVAGVDGSETSMRAGAYAWASPPTTSWPASPTNPARTP
jgi:hypothetical protein